MNRFGRIPPLGGAGAAHSTVALRDASIRGTRRRASGGFTILEVVAAVMVMSVVLASSVAVMHRSFLTIDAARNETAAGQIMQNELERLRLTDWSTVSTYAPVPTLLAPDPAFNSVSSLVGRFTLRRTVTAIQTDLLEITITASWNGADGRTQSRSYTTRYAKNGLYDFFANATS